MEFTNPFGLQSQTTRLADRQLTSVLAVMEYFVYLHRDSLPFVPDNYRGGPERIN